MDAATENTSAMLPSAHRSIREINADIETLRLEREAAIAEMNAHRTENLTRAYSIADVAERISYFANAEPDEELRIWFEDTRTRELRAATSTHSWRGRYDCPAIGGASYTKEYDQQRDDGTLYNQQLTAKTALEALRDLAIDTFQGWKGGDYNYDASDTLYLDDCGDYSGEHIIVGVVRFIPDTLAAEPGLMLVALNVDES